MTERASSWTATQVYLSAAICLVLGVTLGYLFRGSASPASESRKAAIQGQPGASPHQMPTLAQMKEMADKQAQPLLTKLQSDPNNVAVLAQVARVYESTHQFKEAADYYAKALAIKPGDVSLRNAMASCLYYNGDVDGALEQLDLSLKADPTNANSLFNLGLIRWQAKKDSQGALKVWQRLLETNPKLDDRRKAQVQRLIADAGSSTQDARAKF